MTAPGKDTPYTPARGRPSKKDAVLLRERIQQTALREFRNNGYAGTSIDGIARAAGVSRTTIYTLYGDKETLFRGMVHAATSFTDIANHVVFDDRDPAIILREALIVLNNAYFRVPTLEIFRLFIAESDRFPALFEDARDVLLSSLAGLVAYFERLHEAGAMIVGDAKRAALIFNMLSLGSLKPLMVSRDILTPDDQFGHLDLVLETFLRGFLGDRARALAPALNL